MYMKEEYNDSKVHFVVTCSDTGILKAVFTGAGSKKGTETFIALVEQALEKFSSNNLCVLMDLRNQSSVPFSTQIKMGKWLMDIKDKISKIAILGGGRTAQLISKGAKLQQIQFFKDTEENLVEPWLNE